MGVRIHPNVKKPDVEFKCGECGGVKVLEYKEYNARANRSMSGYLFCSRECSKKFNQRGHSDRLKLAHEKKRNAHH